MIFVVVFKLGPFVTVPARVLAESQPQICRNCNLHFSFLTEVPITISVAALRAEFSIFIRIGHRLFWGYLFALPDSVTTRVGRGTSASISDCLAGRRRISDPLGVQLHRSSGARRTITHRLACASACCSLHASWEPVRGDLICLRLFVMLCSFDFAATVGPPCRTQPSSVH